MSNLYDEATPLFMMRIEIFDSLRIIDGDQKIKDLIVAILGRLKPAHTRIEVKFV